MKLFPGITFLFMLIGIVLSFSVIAQEENSVFQLKQQLKQLERQQNYNLDTAYPRTLNDLAYIYSYSYPDSAIALLAGNAERCEKAGYSKGKVNTFLILGDAFQKKGDYNQAMSYYEKSLFLSKKYSFLNTVSLLLNRIGIIHLNKGNYPEALSKFYDARKTAESDNNMELVGATLSNIGIVHFQQGNFTEAEKDYQERLRIAEKIFDSSSMSLAYAGIGEANLKMKNPGKALQNLLIANKLAIAVGDKEMQLSSSISLAEFYYENDSLQKAAVLFDNALVLAKNKNSGTDICNALIGLAKVQAKQGRLTEALANGTEGLQKAETMGQAQLIRDGNEIVAQIYEAQGDGISAVKHYHLFKKYSDSLNNIFNERAAANYKADYEISKKQLEFQRTTIQQRWLTFSAFAALFTLGIVAWIINRNKKRLNHTYRDLQHKNLVIEAQKKNTEETLLKLQLTQAKLIQAEKMASLGELTAGIAHEIQNPLNFVNNFSDVSNEMIAEMNEELDKGNITEAREIATTVQQNLERINHHSKRAETIVKGMLQHSGAATGKKEPININALADEYLRLSYHGLRAKDKLFTADFKTDFDESIDKINVVPQEIGRVLLNLFNNAFYAVNEKKKIAGADYKPEISVETKNLSGKAQIIIMDNGTGIPQNIIDKIFQPFFTTKPTGQGTGLGLSLAYDIITTHGGQIEVKSIDGISTSLIIILS